MAKPGKPTQATVDERVNEVIDCIAKRMKRSEIHKHCIEKLHWDLRPVSIDLYIRKAREAISEFTKQKRTRMLSGAYLDLNHLYKLTLAAKEYRTALEVRKELSKLQGLYDEPRTGVEAEGAVVRDVEDAVDVLLSDDTRAVLIR